MRVVFFGTPPFAERVLQFLLTNGIEVVGVVTRPPKPKGRSSTPIPSAVAQLAARTGIPILSPVKASHPDFIQQLRQLSGDLFAVVAYGQILSAAVLQIPPLGCFNLHASLLPRYRGAAPIQRAIMEGERETGITIMAMNPQMDAGGIVSAVSVPIGPEMTGEELEHLLGSVGQKALLEVLQRLSRGPVPVTEQDGQQATFAPKLTPADLQIYWEKSCHRLHDQVRALAPKPGAWCGILIDGKAFRLKVLKTKKMVGTEKVANRATCGGEGQLIMGCGEGLLELLIVQLEGKRPVSAAEFLRGLGTRSLEFS